MATVEFLLDWLEEIEDPEFALVAEAFASLSLEGVDLEVKDGEWLYPITQESRRPPFRKLKSPARWEYARVIAPRLRRLAGEEEWRTGSSAVMANILQAWDLED